jgi:replicative DNA helicase
MSQLIDPSIARQFDKLPPHSIEAEMCLIASMMLDKEVVGNVVQIVDRDAFYQAYHQILFDLLLKLPHVTDVRSDFALRTVKSAGPLPI